MAAGAHLQPIDFNGLSLTGTYQGNFLTDFDIATQFPLEAVMSEAPGDFPTFVRGDPADRIIPLHIQIVSGPASQAAIDDLKEVFTPSAEITFLRVKDELNNTRRVRCKSLGLTPWEGHDDFSYVASLHAPEPIWENDSAQGGTTSISGSASTNDFTVTTVGNERTFPTFSITPRVEKSSANGYQDHWPIVIAWRSPLEGVDSLGLPYPIDIMNAGWDTATLVSAGDLQADGDDIRVFVDGVELDRYLANFNSANTKVWCSIAFQPQRTATILNAATAGSPANGGRITVSNPDGTTGFPDSGALLIDNECFTYKGKTFEAFLDVRRGRRGTTAASHTASTTIYWVEHDIRVISNYTAAANPKASTDRKPMLDLTNSTNASHRYNTTEGLIAPDTLRSGQWLRERRVRHLFGGDLVSMIQTAGEILVRDTPSAAGSPNFDTISLYSPCGISPSGGTHTLDVKLGHHFVWRTILTDYEGFEQPFAGVEGFDITLFNPNAGSDAYYGPTSFAYVTIGIGMLGIATRVSHQARLAKVCGSERDITTTYAVGDFEDSRQAQSFTLKAEQPILGVTFLVSKSVAGTRGLKVSLYTMSDAGPVSELTSVTIDTADIQTAATRMTVDFAGAQVNYNNRKINIIPGRYAVVFERTAGTGTVSVQGGTLRHAYSGGERWLEDIDATWAAFGADDIAFFITGSDTEGQSDTHFGTGQEVGFRNPRIDFEATTVPAVVRGIKQRGYLLDATLENLTTGQVLTLFAPLIVAQSILKFDCAAHVVTIIYSSDDHEEDALWMVEPGGFDSGGDVQRDVLEWLRLNAGPNSLRYREAIPAQVNIDLATRFRSRWT